MPRASTSKLLMARLKSCIELKAARAEAIERIARKLDENYGPGTGELARGLSERTFAELEARQAELEEASVTLDQQRIAHESARANKASLALACRKSLVPARELLTALYGRAFAKRVGFKGRLAEDPHQLVSVGEHVGCQAAEVEPPPSAWGEAVPAPGELTRDLAEPTKLLAGALRIAAEARAQEVRALVDKNAVVARFDRSFKLAANLLCVLFEAADEPRSAQQLRPSGRRPGTLHVHARRTRRASNTAEAGGPKAGVADGSNGPDER